LGGGERRRNILGDLLQRGNKRGEVVGVPKAMGRTGQLNLLNSQERKEKRTDGERRGFLVKRMLRGRAGLSWLTMLHQSGGERTLEGQQARERTKKIHAKEAGSKASEKEGWERRERRVGRERRRLHFGSRLGK